MLQPGVSCGRCVACLSGRDNECARYEVLGYLNHAGGYAEFVKVPVQNLIFDSRRDRLRPGGRVSADVPDRVAHAGDTRAAEARAKTCWCSRPAAASGRRRSRSRACIGARVFATAGSADKLERARALGASEVIDHHREDIADEIKRLTNRRGVDVVIEHVGEATWARSVRSLARGGRLVTCGATTGANGAHQPERAVREAALDSRLLHGNQGRAASRRAPLFRRPAEAGDRPYVSARRRRRTRTAGWKRRDSSARSCSKCHEPATRRRQPVHLDRHRQHRAGRRRRSGCSSPIPSRSPRPSTRARSRRSSAASRRSSCRRSADCSNISERRSAPATIRRNRGDREERKENDRSVSPRARRLAVPSCRDRTCGSPLRQGFLQKPREDVSVDELERRLPGAVVAAAQHWRLRAGCPSSLNARTRSSDRSTGNVRSYRA